MIKPTYTSPYGNAYTDSMSCNHIISLKNYELTNHLGNVMAVITDKLTASPTSTVTPLALPTLATKRVALNAAYDYYPFGMLMPERYTESNLAQCMPVTQIEYNTLYVPIDIYNNQVPIAKFTLNNVGGTISNNPNGNLLITTEDLHPIQLSTTFAEVIASAKYIIKTNVLNNSAKPTIVKLEQIGANDKWETLATDEVYATKEVNIEVTPTNNSAMRLTYSLSKVSITDNITVASVKYIRVDKQASNHLVVLCNTDADFSDDYRYGFNGQEKDNEIKGVGNSLDFGARVYDSRLGRWLSLDPLMAKYPSLSAYNFVGNSPIQAIDPNGKIITGYLNTIGKSDAMLKGMV